MGKSFLYADSTLVAIRVNLPIILASGSAIRKSMLESVGLPFSVMSSDADEDTIRAQISGKPLPEQATILAQAKAEAVSRTRTDSLIIGSDQIAELNGDILTKPGTTNNAAAQLARLADNTHHQHSAVAVYLNGECLWSMVDTATLTMRALNEGEINAYVTLDNPLHSCGAYCYELHGKHLFSDVNGADATIFGMPLQPLLSYLHSADHITIS